MFTQDNNDDDWDVQVESIIHKQTLEQFKSKVVPIPSPIAKFLTYSRLRSGQAEVKLIRYRPRQKMEAFKRNVHKTIMRLIRENGGPDTPMHITASFDPPYQSERNE